MCLTSLCELGKFWRLKLKILKYTKKRVYFPVVLKKRKLIDLRWGPRVTRDRIGPVVYMDVLEGKSADETICPWRERALLSRLGSPVAAIGVGNVHRYSWHSFGRGAAFLASKNGVADPITNRLLSTEAPVGCARSGGGDSAECRHSCWPSIIIIRASRCQDRRNTGAHLPP